MNGLHFQETYEYETCWSAINYLNIPTQKYGHFSIRASAIRSWNYCSPFQNEKICKL